MNTPSSQRSKLATLPNDKIRDAVAVRRRGDLFAIASILVAVGSGYVSFHSNGVLLKYGALVCMVLASWVAAYTVDSVSVISKQIQAAEALQKSQ